MCNSTADSDSPYCFKCRAEKNTSTRSYCFYHRHLPNVVLIRRNQSDTDVTQQKKQKGYRANKRHRDRHFPTYHPYRPKYTPFICMALTCRVLERVVSLIVTFVVVSRKSTSSIIVFLEISAFRLNFVICNFGILRPSCYPIILCRRRS